MLASAAWCECAGKLASSAGGPPDAATTFVTRNVAKTAWQADRRLFSYAHWMLDYPSYRTGDLSRAASG